MLRLVRAVDRHADVVGLGLRQLGQLHADLAEVQRGNLFSINGDLINRFGPRLVEAAAQLCDDLEQARMKRRNTQAASGR